MTSIGIALALAAALLTQTVVVRMVVGEGLPADLVLLVVIFAGLSRGPLAGLWTGTAGGLLQDLLSGGLIGISGLAKCITGVLVGTVGFRFIIETLPQHLILIVAASAFHVVSVLGVYALVGAAPEASAAFVLSRAATDGVIGGAALAFARALPAVRQRVRRTARGPWVLSRDG